MMTIRLGRDRGHANHGWLDTYHSFSFADYYDPGEMGWGPLRVINEDTVQPGMGFGTHGHRDMEIITYVLEGALQHRDSMGNGAVIRPGEVQRMSAGRGVMHSEFNASRDTPVHFLQIWIQPDTLAVVPSYEQRFFAPEEKRARLRLIASADGREGSVTIHQDASVYAALLENDEVVHHRVAPERLAYLHVARGLASVNGEALAAGDGVKLQHDATVEISSPAGAEILLFDLPS